VLPVVRQMFEIMVANVPFPTGLVLRQLLNPALADPALDLLGPRGQALYPLLHNTVNVTGISGGEQVSGTPAKLTASILACLLPGFSSEALVDELRRAIGDQVELEVTCSGETGLQRPDMGLYDTLCDILREADPQGVPVPLLFTSASDARHFARLGIQTYGFQPMNLPPDVDMATLAHGADERVPVEALEFGTAAIYQVLQRYGKQQL
jgi:acetylornithine deacetylase/succinyl-diaminopimelate desuccinylase-like protein